MQYPERARRVADFLTVTAFIERQVYPLNAKYYQKELGNFSSIMCRTKAPELFDATAVTEVEQFMRFTRGFKDDLLCCHPNSRVTAEWRFI